LLPHHAAAFSAGVPDVKRWIMMAAVALSAAATTPGHAASPALPACDPATEAGWRVMPSLEVTDTRDGVPYRTGADWAVDRTTTLLPFCNYFSPVGSYSLRSYSLDPFDRTERVTLCRGADPGASAPVAPYAGPCPPP